MPNESQKPQDVAPPWPDAVIDELILRAGDERAAIRALLDELADARALASFGYIRGRAPGW